jgi:hypothetical protein
MPDHLNTAVLFWFAKRLARRMPAADVLREHGSFLAAVKAAGRWDGSLLRALDLTAHHEPQTGAEVLRHFLAYHDHLRAAETFDGLAAG